ncbi:MAG: hypothetical protein KKB50_17105 [Planctomycetes bacterium]|nr:hypothetical protein [Planctomycetota bacterium]
MPRTQGLAVDAAGRIYVADAMMSTVRVFDPTGAELGKILEYGFDSGDLRTPGGLALSNDGARLYVVSTNTSSVEIYETPELRNSRDPDGDRDGDQLGTNYCAYDVWHQHAGTPTDLIRRPGPLGGVFDGPHMVDDSPTTCGRCHGFRLFSRMAVPVIADCLSLLTRRHSLVPVVYSAGKRLVRAAQSSSC